jgi:hypothetical protein
MSVRSEKAAAAPTNALAALDVSDSAPVASPDQLGEGNNFCVANPENPLKRNLVVSIKATLNDFCLQKTRGTWAPTQEALRSIFQQKKFTSLDGAAEAMGDLKSVVLHDMKVNHVKSTFPMSLGKLLTVHPTTYPDTYPDTRTVHSQCPLLHPRCPHHRRRRLHLLLHRRELLRHRPPQRRDLAHHGPAVRRRVFGI